jgi:hypothetical protein
MGCMIWKAMYGNGAATYTDPIITAIVLRLIRMVRKIVMILMSPVLLSMYNGVAPSFAVISIASGIKRAVVVKAKRAAPAITWVSVVYGTGSSYC